MTPEKRLDRAERILLMMAKTGDRTRREWRAKVNILIDMQIRNEEERKTASREQDEKINMLIHSQMETGEYLRNIAASMEAVHSETEEAIKNLAAQHTKTEEAIKNLAAEHVKTEESLRKTEESQRKTEESQRKTDEALRKFLDSLRRGRNGDS